MRKAEIIATAFSVALSACAGSARNLSMLFKLKIGSWIAPPSQRRRKPTSDASLSLPAKRNLI